MKQITAMIFSLFVVTAVAAWGGASPVTVFEKGVEGPYSNFLYTATPVLESVRRTPAMPLAGQDVRVSAVVRRSVAQASLPVKRVALTWSVDDGATWESVDMLRDDNDPEYYVADIPAAAAGQKVRYYVSAWDVSGGMSSEMPAYAQGFPKDTANMLSVHDENAPDHVLPQAVDVTGLYFGYDDEHFYVRAELEGKPGKGNMATTGANMYLIPVLNLDKASGIEDFMNIDMLVYAPLAGQMLGIKPYGLFRISEILETKKSIEGSDVKFMKDDNSLSFRFRRAALGDMPSQKLELGMLTVAAKSMDSMYPQESAPFLTAYLRTHDYTVADAAREVSLMAGAAQVEITPPVGTPLAGYGDRQGKSSTGVHDPLMAQALVLQAGDQKYVFLTADFFLMRRRMFQDIGRTVEEKLGIPREHVLASASHSHCTSGGMFPELSLLGGKVRTGLYEDTLARMVSAIEEADGRLAPARIGFGTGDATGYSNNRVTDGGPVDPDLRVMRVDAASGGAMAVLFNFSAHPTILGGSVMEFSSDFVGPARAKIQDAFPGAVAMYANGIQGNQSPACPGDCGGGFDKVKNGGGGLGDIAVSVAQAVDMNDSVPVTFVSREIILQPEVDVRVTMDALRIGDTALLTIPGEMFVELAQPVKEQAGKMGFKNLFLLGLTNDGIGYLVTPEAYEQRVYESTFALFGPGEGVFIADQLMSLLNMLEG